MTDNKNGNGHFGGSGDDKNNIVVLPIGKEREKLKKAEEERIRADYKARKAAEKKATHEPFFRFGNIPPFTQYFMASLVLVHLVFSFAIDDNMRLFTIYNFGFIPLNFTDLSEFSPLALLTLFSHAFLHGGWMHLVFNVVMGISLGIFMERIIGTRRLINFFIASSLCGLLAFTALAPFSPQPLIGASGGISGEFGAFLYLSLSQVAQEPKGYNVYSTQRIMDGQHALKAKARNLIRDKGPWPIIIIWGLIMTALGLLSGENVAWSAHLGGYIGGIALIYFWKKGRIPL